MKALAFACMLACLLAASPAHARKRPALTYGLVECSGWPWSGNTAAGAALRHLRHHVKGRKLRAFFRVLATGQRAMLEARHIGTINGRKVWSVRGPKALGAALALAGCTVIQYRDVLTLPAAKRDWIQARSTCLGAATRNGRPLTVWPCGARGVVEVRIDGLAPRVMHGGSVWEVAGVDPP